MTRPTLRSTPDPAAPPPGRDETTNTTDRGAWVRAAAVLREVAAYEQALDPCRAGVTAAQAALLQACARDAGGLPERVAVAAQRVAVALDRATGQRCGTG